MSVRLYLLFLTAVGGLRLVEVAVSRRNRQRLDAKGIEKVREPGFRWMIAFHVLMLFSAALEVGIFHRPLILPLAFGAGAVFVLANIVRWWVIRVMAEHWNIQVMASARIGVVTGGPYRWVRHPNYAAVFIEMIAVPLIYSAWITAIGGAIAHIVVLRRRLEIEEAVLMSSPLYVANMAWKPRFVPSFFSTRERSPRSGS